MSPRSSEEKVEESARAGSPGHSQTRGCRSKTGGLGFSARKITAFGCTVVSITTRAKSERLAGFGLGRDR